MIGKIYMVVGVCVVILMFLFNDIKIILVGIVLLVVGFLIVDIDIFKLKGVIFLKNLFGCIIIFLILGLVVKEKFNINIFNYII